MSIDKKIEQCLRTAPKPPTPDGLLDKLQKDIALGDIKTRRSALRRWFAPTGGAISPWRVAAAAIIAISLLLPLTYGATRIMRFVVEEFTVIHGVDDEQAKYITAYAFNPTITGDCITNKEEAKEAEKEMLQLIKKGKAEEVSPGVYKGVLSNGEEVIYDTLGIPIEILQSENRKEKIKELTEEIQKLKKAGDFERTFLDEVENNGIKIRIYKHRYTLSNGSTITLTAGYEVKE